MKKFLLDANRASFAPRYLLFDLLVNDKHHFGQFSVTHMADPFYKTTHLTLEDFGSLARYKSGSASETIERIPTENIKILGIIDSITMKNPSPLSQIIEISDKICTFDTSFARYKIKEDILSLLGNLYNAVKQYGSEHPTSNYKTLLAYIDQKEPELQKLDREYTNNEATNREIMRENIAQLKDEIKRWVIDLLFCSAQK